jgi:predicted RNA-binding Zn ribbon-like protein
VATSTLTTQAPLFGEPLPVELMNTIWADRGTGHDALRTSAEAGAWLAAVAGSIPLPGNVKGALTAAVTVELRELRDALRQLAAEVTGDPRPAAAAPASATSAGTGHRAAVAALNRAAALAPAWPELTWPAKAAPHSGVRSAGSVAEVAISAIAGQGIELFAGPLRAELRACLAPGCVLYFVRDHPRREWCSAACGNRARVARHYQRHHG